MVTDTELPIPALLVAVHVSKTPAVLLDSVVGVQPLEDAIPESTSVTTQETDAGPVYQPFAPSCPVTDGTIDGGGMILLTTSFWRTEASRPLAWSGGTTPSFTKPFTSWVVRSGPEIDGFLIVLDCTIITIWSPMVGASLGASPLRFTTVLPLASASTTPAVAVTGVVTGVLVTEKAWADHKRQSPVIVMLAESAEIPGPTTEETSNVLVSQRGPSRALNKLENLIVPALPVKDVGVWILN
jgi:hypothetical protein